MKSTVIHVQKGSSSLGKFKEDFMMTFKLSSFSRREKRKSYPGNK